MQEVLFNQLRDIGRLLQMQQLAFQRVGVGRSTGKPGDSEPPLPGNEPNPIFFDTTIWKLKSFDTFWLSETPFEVSQARGTNNHRICGTAVFETIVDEVSIMATHWDHGSDYARALAASLILRRAAHEAEKTRRPIFLLGDFNSQTQYEKGGQSTGYEIITGIRPPIAINEDFARCYPIKQNGFAFHNLITTAPPRRVSGNSATFTDFTGVQDSKKIQRQYTQIDFILGGNNGGWKCTAHRQGQNFHDDGLMFSDHRPVMADIELLHGFF